MDLINSRYLKWYFFFYDFIALQRVMKADTDEREIHAHTAMVFSTGILMWSYAILAWVTISSPVPGIVGVVCSTIHLLSPLLFRFTNRTFFISNIAITAGIIHQITFSYFTGGFYSFTLKWFAILPMLSGIICGMRGALIWALITILVTTKFLIMHLIGYDFPNQISENGVVWGTALLMYGWIFLSTVMITVFILMREHSETLLQEQGRKIDDLFRVLFHDLANSLGRINIGISLAKKDNGASSRGIEIASLAADSMMDITQSVRKMYAVSKGKAEVDLAMTSLNGSVEYLQKIFSSELEKKNLRIVYDMDKNRGVNLLVEPVSFKNQVLGNIISNAIKFSHPGGSIDIISYPMNHHYQIVEIKDHGIGMPQILISQMFDLSKKTTRPGTEGEIGTGFGMHIMKSFVEMYHGQVLIESKEAQRDSENKGTTFRLILKGEWAS